MEFVCEECEEKGYDTPHHFTFTDQSLDWEVVDVDERQMGVETTYQADWEDTCPQCGALVSAEFRTWEYPAGCANHAEADYSGIAPVNSGERIIHDVSFRDAPDED